MSLDLPGLTQAVARHGVVVRALVLAVAGSVPRERGTSMLFWHGGQDGTIGGGALEWQAEMVARDLLRPGAPARITRRLPLGPALGQCCGGAVTLLWESFTPETLPGALPFARPLGPAAEMPAAVARRLQGWRPGDAPAEIAGWVVEGPGPAAQPLWIWGAGHVGRALVNVLAPLPDWAITWCDTAPDRYPASLPDGVAALPAADLPMLARHAPQDARHLILTMSHEIDLALCHALLTRGFAACGLIGSATKWARFRSRLRQLGHADAEIAGIACPIGDPRLGKHPQAIAVGVAAALLRESVTNLAAATAGGTSKGDAAG